MPDTLAVGVSLQLLANRPDVRQAERNLAQLFYLELLTVQLSLLDAETAQLHAHYDRIQSIINPYHAVDGGKYFTKLLTLTHQSLRVRKKATEK